MTIGDETTGDGDGGQQAERDTQLATTAGDLTELLCAVPFLGDLSAQECGSLLAAGTVRHFSPADFVFREGEPGSEMLLILAGQVEIIRRGENVVRLATLAEGAYFGELAVLDGRPRSACARALTQVRLFSLSRTKLLELLSSNPRILSEVLRSLSERMRSSSGRLTDTVREADRVRTEAELERLRAISQMVAGVAHELNTPLGIVNSAVGVITQALRVPTLQGTVDGDDAQTALDDIREAAGLIQSSVERANRLVRSFKNLSARQVVDRIEDTDIEDVVRETVNLYSIQARRAGLQVHVESSLVDKQWRGYPGYLSQVLLNLLKNAEVHAYRDSQGGRVDVRLEQHAGGDYALQVQDHGRGMSATELKRVFEPFFTTGRDRGGTGLGMAIVHSLVTDSLKGTVVVDSNPEQGTTVVIVVPRAVPMPMGKQEAQS